MKVYLLVVAILAFSTSIDFSEAAACYTRFENTLGEGYVIPDCTRKCYAYYIAAGANLGACDAGGCDNPATKLFCKECTTADCNKRSLIRRCYSRADSSATGEGTIDQQCTGTPADAKCVSYYDGSGNNLGKCLDGGCSHSDISTGSLHCKECTADNCNVKSLIRKCYVRTLQQPSGDGTSTNCATTLADPKCVSYYDASGNNIGECKAGGCGAQPNCQECAGDDCNTRALIATTAAPATTTAAGAAKTTPCAAATRASVGWQTGIIAASVCVLVLMKPF